MENNTQSPQRRVSDALDDATHYVYEHSAVLLKRGLIALKVFIVFYTFPHALHAFGVGWFEVGTLGPFSIEAAFLFTSSHFTFGLISSKTHRQYAMLGLVTTTVLLMANSTLSQLLYMNAAGSLDAGAVKVMLFYQAFILPITTIVAGVVSLMLMAHHPKVMEIGQTMRHVASVKASEQAASRERQQATAEAHLLRTRAEVAKVRWSLGKEEMDAELELAKMEADIEERKALIFFDTNTRKAALDKMNATMSDYLKSTQFDNRVTVRVRSKITKVFDGWDEEDKAQAKEETKAPAPLTSAAPRQRPLVEMMTVPETYAPSANGHGHPKPPASPFRD